MSIISPENYFLWILWLFGSVLFVLALILVMHFLMPNKVLLTYFKPPYFRIAECALFTGIPYSPIRTVMFMTVIAFPYMGKKRQLTEVWHLVPSWYRVTSKLLIITVILLGGLMTCLAAGFYIYSIVK